MWAGIALVLGSVSACETTPSPYVAALNTQCQQGDSSACGTLAELEMQRQQQAALALAAWEPYYVPMPGQGWPEMQGGSSVHCRPDGFGGFRC